MQLAIIFASLLALAVSQQVRVLFATDDCSDNAGHFLFSERTLAFQPMRARGGLRAVVVCSTRPSTPLLAVRVMGWKGQALLPRSHAQPAAKRIACLLLDHFPSRESLAL